MTQKHKGRSKQTRTDLLLNPTDADLKANRAGRLSDAQRAAFSRPHRTLLFLAYFFAFQPICLLSAFIYLFASIALENLIPEGLSVVGAFLISCGVAGVSIWIVKHIPERLLTWLDYMMLRRVRVLEDIVTRATPTTHADRFFIILETSQRRINVSQAVWRQFRTGSRYTLYLIRNGRQVVAFELAEDPPQRLQLSKSVSAELNQVDQRVSEDRITK